MRRWALCFLLVAAPGTAPAALFRAALGAPPVPAPAPALAATLSVGPAPVLAALPLPAILAPARAASPESLRAVDAPDGRGALLERLLERVALDDVPGHRAVLRRALARMLESRSARALAACFVAENARASARFEAFPDSSVHAADGRRLFDAQHAESAWIGGETDVRVNAGYLRADRSLQDRDLPPILAQELFGQGRWYARAAGEDAVPAFQLHELKDANSWMIGWLADWELNGRFEGRKSWELLRDPAGRKAAKLQVPGYARAFSNEELGRPVESVEARLAAAREQRARLEAERGNYGEWVARIDHFLVRHRTAPERLSALRGEFAAAHQQLYPNDLAITDAIIASLESFLEQMTAGPGRALTDSLKRAATLPFLAELREETDGHARRLLDLVPNAGARSAETAEDSAGRGQITFAALQRMVADDQRHRPAHWGLPPSDAVVPPGAPLLQRLLASLWLDDEGIPEHGAALRQAVARMLRSPSARNLAAIFLAEGQSAIVRFQAYDGSRVYDDNGRRFFRGTRATTFWNGDESIVALNSDYLAAGGRFQKQDMPSILAHELFGHGLWFGRAERQVLWPIFGFHELNEINAKLVGWLVDLELDGRIEDVALWAYLENPADYAAAMKLRVPFYAALLSTLEMSRPIKALRDRLAVAQRRRAALELEDVAAAEKVILTIGESLAQLQAAPDLVAQLKSASTHPLFRRLQLDVDENARRLRMLISRLGLRRT